MNRAELKTSKSKVLKDSQLKDKYNSRHKIVKPKVLNDPKPYYIKAKVQSKKKSFKTNP